MPSERFDFPNAGGEKLSALLDRPTGQPVAFALFAHCFTCGKDNLAAKRIAEGLTARGIAVLRFDFTGLGASEGRAVIDDALRRTGLSDFRGAYPKQLSGGMRQRVGIARALAVRPAILLMDEPLSALDSQTRELLMEDFIRLLADGAMGAVYVTHNLEEAVRLADRIVVLSRRPGRIRETVTIPMTRGERGAIDARGKLLALQNELWSLIREEAIDAEREVLDA